VAKSPRSDKRPTSYNRSVFINCPFDPDYASLFHALIFAIQECGLTPRCALELEDSTEVRISKISRLIGQCRFAIHDLSRIEVGPSGLPRFNMPLELGIFYGAKIFGSAEQKTKVCLVLSKERFEYQKYISDFAGQDIAAHGNEPHLAIKALRGFLSPHLRRSLQSPKVLWDRYTRFNEELRLVCAQKELDENELQFWERIDLAIDWSKENRQR
jgi:hypothetical protein